MENFDINLNREREDLCLRWESDEDPEVNFFYGGPITKLENMWDGKRYFQGLPKITDKAHD